MKMIDLLPEGEKQEILELVERSSEIDLKSKLLPSELITMMKFIELTNMYKKYLTMKEKNPIIEGVI
jgi:hypothetical protein